MPPFSTAVFFQAKWVNCESTETPMTSGVASFEFFQAVIESDDFRRADESEIERPEEQDYVLAF